MSAHAIETLRALRPSHLMRTTDQIAQYDEAVAALEWLLETAEASLKYPFNTHRLAVAVFRANGADVERLEDNQ